MSRPVGLSGVLWPIHPKPLDDELLSSWMIRLARAYEIKPVSFWRLFWPVNFRHVDVDAPGGLLDLLAMKTATPFERTVQTTLTAIAQEQYDVTLTRRFCQKCLAADPEPYFRRRWQLCSFLLCDLHGIPLITGCPRLGHDPVPERVPLSRDSIAWCVPCAEDLRTARRQAAEPFTPARPAGQVLDWERRLWNLIGDMKPRADRRPRRLLPLFQRPSPSAAFSRKRLPSRI